MGVVVDPFARCGDTIVGEHRRGEGGELSAAAEYWLWHKFCDHVLLIYGGARIPTFAGHRHTDSTLRYVHLSGRDLADKLNAGMQHVHAWRVAMLTDGAETVG